MSLPIFNQPYAIDFRPTEFWDFKTTPFTKLSKNTIRILEKLRQFTLNFLIHFSCKDYNRSEVELSRNFTSFVVP